ncbi:MAG: hypothetical protein AMXMBFR84_32340 [Candidatus Hydrogenedentota bacterium]
MLSVDVTRSLKHVYSATGMVNEVTCPAGTYLACDGSGDPATDLFASAIERLHAVAYTAKFQLKENAGINFKVPKLECIWLMEDPDWTARENWRWQLLLRVPPELTQKVLKESCRTLSIRKNLDASDITRVSRGREVALHILHVGPYETLGQSYSTIMEYASQHQYRQTGPYHEIYLSDPRRIVPARLKTIVRVPVAAKKTDTVKER